MNKNANGYAWFVSGVDKDGNKYSGIQYAWYGNPAIDFFAKSKGVHFVAGSAVKPKNLMLEICEQLGIVEYR
jgi:hypothetical protein